ncbi:hypothetical protein ASG72_02120 [Bosea sp. Leaf344]|uniref:hypothetical protein n=1 Tax=Bosea sp. Leaf344 TaxID=1736346 RepID=UPI00070059DD|nr:hypothetical protein [Bosea sp. Leaf344]KQU54458.1 hypothetical protein ASG72_02120 [Bosea sp. Leaf344]
MTALNPALRTLIAAAAARYQPPDNYVDGPNPVELPASLLASELIEFALDRATKADLLGIIRTTLALEAQ